MPNLGGGGTLKSMNKTTSGFTIVELLIVIVIIAILAAISIIGYNGFQNRANDSAVQSDLANLSKKLLLHYTENTSYPSESQLASLGMKIAQSSYDTGGTSGNLTYCAIMTGANARYSIAARSKSGQIFAVSSAGPITYSGSYNGAHGSVCPNLGIPTTESGYTASQGYQAPSWVPPGWKTWTQ